jgi:hypothetical protein
MPEQRPQQPAHHAVARDSKGITNFIDNFFSVNGSLFRLWRWVHSLSEKFAFSAATMSLSS